MSTRDRKVFRHLYILNYFSRLVLVLEKGYSCQKAADHLGVSLSALSRWVKAERPPNVSEALSKKSGLSLSEHDELRRLRKENEQLRMEREILKKAAVFFAKEVE